MPSLKDAYIFAIINEVKSQNLYKILSIAAKESASKQTFEELSLLEKVHEEKVTRLFKEQFPAETLEIDRSVLPRLKRNQEIVDPREALLFAVGREEMASSGYEELMEKSENPEIKELFGNLAKEEQYHKEVLETEILKISGELLWFDENELSGLFEY